jgi:hypothetical protein
MKRTRSICVGSLPMPRAKTTSRTSCSAG